MNFKRIKELLLPGGVAGRKRLGALFVCLVLCVTVMANVVLYDLSNQFGWYFYTAEQYKYDITDRTKSLFEGIDQPVRIIFCTNRDNLLTTANNRLVLETAEQLAEMHDFITVEYLNPYLEPGKVKPYRGEEGTQTINESTVIFQRGTESGGTYGEDYLLQTVERFYVLDDSSYPLAYTGEKVFAASILWVTKYEKPIAYYTVNHGESSSTSFYNMLTYAGYDLRPLDLIREEIDPKAELIIVSNPLYDLEKSAEGSLYLSEIDKLNSFLEEGGNLYVTVDPDTPNLRNLKGLLSDWGMAVSDSIVRDMTGAITSDGYTITAAFPDSGLGYEIGQRIASGDRRMLVSYASPIESVSSAVGAAVSPIVIAEATASEYADGEEISSGGGYTMMALSERDSGERGRIFLASSSMVTAYDAIQTTKYLNEDLVYAVFEEFGREDIPMGISPMMIDSSIIENLTMGEARTYTVILAAVVPLTLVALCVFVMLRRRAR